MVALPTFGVEVRVRSDVPDVPCAPAAPVVEMRTVCGGGGGGSWSPSVRVEEQASAPAIDSTETAMMTRIFPPGCLVVRLLLPVARGPLRSRRKGGATGLGYPSFREGNSRESGR